MKQNTENDYFSSGRVYSSNLELHEALDDQVEGEDVLLVLINDFTRLEAAPLDPFEHLA